MLTVVGFDDDTMPDSAKGQNKSYKDYIMGTGYDKIEKTPEWAAPITQIPAERIRELAADMAAGQSPIHLPRLGPATSYQWRRHHPSNLRSTGHPRKDRPSWY